MVSEQHDTAGSSFSDEDVERWAAEAEAGYDGAHLGRAIAGPPVGGAVMARMAVLRLSYAKGAALVFLAALACMALATRLPGISGLGVTLLLTSVPAAVAGLCWAYRAAAGLPEVYARQRRLMLWATGIEVLALAGMVVLFLLSPETYLPG